MSPMFGKAGSRKRAQVSIEILVLTSVVIILSLTVFGYYTQIMDSTTAMQLLKVEALKHVEKAEEPTIIEKIEYKIDAATGAVDFCLFTNPGDLLDATAKANIQLLIEDKTGFAQNSVQLHQIPPDADTSCE